MKTATGFLLLISLLVGEFAAPPAHAQTPTRIERLVIQQTDESLSFYSVDDMGTLTWIVSLPEFCIRNLSGPFPISCEWQIHEALHIVASPDGQHVAFTARNFPHRALFVYSLNSWPVMRQIELPAEAAIRWSPDSSLILLVPPSGYTDHADAIHNAYLYDLASYELRAVTQDDFPPYDFHWSPDGQHIIYAERGLCDSQPCVDNLVMVERSELKPVVVTDVARNVAEDMGDLPVYPEFLSCWVNIGDWFSERLYYAVYCHRGGDAHYVALYSTDLTPNGYRLELNLSTSYPDDTLYTTITHTLPTADGLVIIVAGYDSHAQHYWRLFRWTELDEWMLVSENKSSRLHTAALVPDQQWLAITYDDYGAPPEIALFDLQTGRVTSWPTEDYGEVIQWLDDDRLLYTDFSQKYYLMAPYPTWLLNTKTGISTEFIPGLEGSMWVFPLDFILYRW